MNAQQNRKFFFIASDSANDLCICEVNGSEPGSGLIYKIKTIPKSNYETHRHQFDIVLCVYVIWVY